MSRRLLAPLLAIVPIMLVGALALGGVFDSDKSAQQPAIQTLDDAVGAQYSYIIPAGTGEQLDAGEPVEILPAELHVKVGEVLSIRNDDSRGHTVGAFYVGSNETLTQKFSTPGVLSGDCSVHPSGAFALIVEA